MAVHDPRIIDFLDACEKTPYAGSVFRATLAKTNPLAPSLRGGRWMVPNRTAVLYTSCVEDGALAEVAHNFSRFDPLPPSEIRVHEIRVAAKKTAHLSQRALASIGLTASVLEKSLSRTQELGAAAAFLEYDAIMVPSLRWNTDNLVLFADPHGFDSELEVVMTKSANWIEWLRRHKA